MQTEPFRAECSMQNDSREGVRVCRNYAINNAIINITREAVYRIWVSVVP